MTGIPIALVLRMKQKSIAVSLGVLFLFIGSALYLKSKHSSYQTVSMASSQIVNQEIASLHNDLDQPSAPQTKKRQEKSNPISETYADKIERLSQNYKKFCGRTEDLQQRYERVSQAREQYIEKLKQSQELSQSEIEEFNKIEFISASVEMILGLCAADQVAQN